ncbi:MAG: O-antigen ligase family protein [bacterium]
MEYKAIKTIIFIWLALMCLMDYFVSGWQGRVLLWGMYGLLALVWVVQNISQKRGFIPFKEKGIMAVLYLFLFWVCVFIFFSQDSFLGVRKMFPLLAGFLCTYIFYDFLSRSKKNRKFFMNVVTLLTLFVSLWSTIEALQKIAHGESSFKNVYAGFCNQNFLGYFLFLFAPLMISYYLVNSPFKGKYAFGRVMFIMTIGYALIVSSSRSAWNGFIMAMVYMLSWKSKVLGAGFLLLSIILNSVIFIVQGGGMYENAWQEVYKDRASAWDICWKVFSQNPLSGLGWGIVPKGIPHAHNLYLSNAVQMGIFSVILVLAFYILFFYRSAQTAKRITDPESLALLQGSTSIYFGHLFYNLTDLWGIMVSTSATSVSFFPYILIALPLSIIHFCHQQEEAESQDREDRIISTAAS